MKRREFIKKAAVGSAGLAGSFLLPKFLRDEKPISMGNPNFQPDVEIELTALESEIPILPGKYTKVWKYRAKLVKGPPGTIQELKNTYIGPIFRFKKGQKVRIIFYNHIPDKTIVHWHGLHVPQEADGHPRFVIKKGQRYVYEFEIKNRAGTYWFHPHPHGRTGPQVYMGLAGLLLITDEEENSLPLPREEFDVPIVIQDRTFNGRNQLVYLMGGMMERMRGFLGEQILVNGQPNFTLNVSTSVYRLRVLNGSNSRIYKLAWSNGMPLTVIGTDGGLLEKPITKNYIMLGPAERVDLWVDFTNLNPGDELVLKSLAFSGAATGGMGGGMMGRDRGRRMGRGNVPDNGEELDVLRVKITRRVKNSLKLPEKLSRIEHYNLGEAVNKNSPRTFRFEMRRMRPTINGRTFQMTAVAKDEIVKLNTLEVWELVNASGGMGMMGGMMQMPHPVHIHGLQFQVIERTPSIGWETIRDGFIDSGWKDTVLLMPGMRVKVLMKFEDFTGLYLYHCHNLEHEDLGMMRNYLVKA